MKGQNDCYQRDEYWTWKEKMWPDWEQKPVFILNVSTPQASKILWNLSPRKIFYTLREDWKVQIRV
jgi:hypothetical protein